MKANITILKGTTRNKRALLCYRFNKRLYVAAHAHEDLTEVIAAIVATTLDPAVYDNPCRINISITTKQYKE